MKSVRIPALAAGLFILAASLPAATFTITFDAGDPIGGLAAGTTLSSQYFLATGATFSPNAFAGPGGPTGNWATDTDMTIVSSTGADVGGLGTPSLVSGNLLRSFSGWLGESGDPSIRITFSTPVTSFSADFAGISTSSSTRIFAYAVSTLLTTGTAAGGGQRTVTVSSLTPITSVVITPGDFFDWVGVDNIKFTTAGDVPEPSTLGLLGLGLAGLALARRRAGSMK